MSYFYKNTSYASNTFYGVTFKPGETKEVPGPINCPKYIPVPEPKIDKVSKVVSDDHPSNTSTVTSKPVAKSSNKINTTTKPVVKSKPLDALKDASKSTSKDISSGADKAPSDKNKSQGGKTDGTDSNK